MYVAVEPNAQTFFASIRNDNNINWRDVQTKKIEEMFKQRKQGPIFLKQERSIGCFQYLLIGIHNMPGTFC